MTLLKIDRLPGHLARRYQQIAVAVFHAEAEAAGFDLTPVQYAALSAICRNPGMDQATLAGVIAYDRTTITGVVDRLARKDLVVRKTNEEDRRARRLFITPAGESTLREIQPAVEAAQDILLSGLTDEEKTQFVELLHKATEALNDRSRAPLRKPR